MWLRHWGLTGDPFAVAGSPYIPMATHDEAVARLVFCVERRQREIALVADAGLGKTMVVRQALQAMRGPRRRTVLVDRPGDDRQWLGRIADGLGLPFAVGSDREGVWRALARAIGAAAVEGVQLVVAVDRWDGEAVGGAVQDLSALQDLAESKGSCLSIIRVGREPDLGAEAAAWTLAIGLERLTRSEAEVYLFARLEAAGCHERLFTPRAIGRLHAWCEGVPRALGEMASVALVAGAIQGLEVVTPEVVDGVARDGLIGGVPAEAAR